jgi:hypothetical protein
VVNDVRMNSLQGDPTLQAYLPVRQVGQRSGAFVVRGSTDAAALGRSIEAAVQEVDSNLPLFNIQTMDQIIEAAIGNERLTMVLLMGFCRTGAADGGDRRVRRDRVLGFPAHA